METQEKSEELEKINKTEGAGRKPSPTLPNTATGFPPIVQLSKVALWQGRPESRRSFKTVDWRRELPSLYVGNLPLEIIKEDLRRIFAQYGEVADVYIAHGGRDRTRSAYTFGFVRFFNKDVLFNILDLKKEWFVHGRRIVVRKSVNRGSQSDRMPFYKPSNEISLNKIQVPRSYAEVVTDGQANSEKSGEKYKAEFDQSPEENEWIRRSIVGEMHKLYVCSDVQEALQENGISCRVRYLGGLKSLFTFQSVEDMQTITKSKEDFLLKWCSSFFECPEDYVCSERIGWLEIYDMPLKAWNLSFFKTAGEFVGKFILLDDSTKERSRLDRARILVSYDSKTRTTPSIVVTDNKSEFKVKIHLKPSNAFEDLLSGVDSDHSEEDEASVLSMSEVPETTEKGRVMVGASEDDALGIGEEAQKEPVVHDDRMGIKPLVEVMVNGEKGKVDEEVFKADILGTSDVALEAPEARDGCMGTSSQSNVMGIIEKDREEAGVLEGDVFGTVEEINEELEANDKCMEIPPQKLLTSTTVECEDLDSTVHDEIKQIIHDEVGLIIEERKELGLIFSLKQAEWEEEILKALAAFDNKYLKGMKGTKPRVRSEGLSTQRA